MKKNVIFILKKNEQYKLLQLINSLKKNILKNKKNNKKLFLLKNYFNDYTNKFKNMCINGITNYQWSNYNYLINMLKININHNKIKEKKYFNNIRKIKKNIYQLNNKINVWTNLKFKIVTKKLIERETIEEEFFNDILQTKCIIRDVI
ncbi:flagellar protein [Buchnera aphidicola (Nipponaphis monzeni)]|uniref:Flagellar protein n=1 Tax=Buchnera aphidicola (Nipponaphis monzeni) TaxID=2495405 RepID=A0A455T9Q8_9GAMM|nr:hypothetical protein [Buchnera aphidicola]BBI01078.1 flagellar protein [Buchnera aphidicola (Nipponaphis monzeni)]